MWSFLLIALTVLDASASEAASHRAQWEAWRARRLEALRKEDGWLTLVGLFWLKEGDNPLGSAPTNRIVLPAGHAPAHMGSIRMESGRASISVDPRVEVTHEGKFITKMRLQTDGGGGAEPTILKHGTLSFYVIARGGRLGVRVKDSQAQTLKNFRGTETFPYDDRDRVEARFEPAQADRSISVPNVLGAVEPEKSPGTLVFAWKGKTYRLDPVIEEGETDLFIIFADSTNGHETYGGGRFLYARPPVEGKTTLDFNRAYNPPCVFTPWATCPLPPQQNRLPFRVEAGEKGYAH